MKLASRIRFFAAAAAVALAASSMASSMASAEPAKPECLAGAKPGGGFDLTCRLLGAALQNANLIKVPMAVTYMEGGVGAVAYNHVIGTRPGDLRPARRCSSRRRNSASTTKTPCAGSARSAPITACSPSRPIRRSRR
jgi:tripartite-type tricarboxylate transporter receptor subunit TctC